MLCQIVSLVEGVVTACASLGSSHSSPKFNSFILLSSSSSSSLQAISSHCSCSLWRAPPAPNTGLIFNWVLQASSVQWWTSSHYAWYHASSSLAYSINRLCSSNCVAAESAGDTQGFTDTSTRWWKGLLNPSELAWWQDDAGSQTDCLRTRRRRQLLSGYRPQ